MACYRDSLPFLLPLQTVYINNVSVPSSQKLVFSHQCRAYAPTTYTHVLTHSVIVKNANILQRVEPLLCNDSELGGNTKALSVYRLGKHVPAVTDTHATE
jgi:hypothetical protein